jgi:beta-glucosidase
MKYKNPNLSVEERINDLLAIMTLEEKVAQLYCFGRVVEMTGILFDQDGKLLPDKTAALFKDGACQLGRPAQRSEPRHTAQITNAIQKFLAEETRLGIPALFNEEGLHGLMATGSTSFPQAIALASTWNPELVHEVFTVVAKETRVRGSNYVYTPVLDLARDARWGRVEETFGEDPYLVTQMGVAAIKGLQGEGESIDSEHVIACAKHFAVHGQPEGGQNSAPGNISERTIREEFLPPFKAAVQEAGVGAVMASYNEIDGIPAHINHWLLQTVLRDEWGYQGFVTSDGLGVPQIIRLHRITNSLEEAARLCLEAGVDCEVPRGLCYPTLIEQAKAGSVSMETIDHAVRRILRAKLLLGLLDGVTPHVDPDQAARVTNCAEHRALALKAARQAITLLKNEDAALPLDAGSLKSIAVIGPNAADLHLGGYAEDPQRGTSVLDGIQQKVGDQLNVQYAEGCRITTDVQGYAAWHQDDVNLSDPADDTARINKAVKLAQEVDIVILVLGGNEGTCREGWWFDHLGDRDNLDLPGRQNELVEAVLATGTPTIAVLINGRPLTINLLADAVPAILECWYLGQETGIAVADVIFGKVNPGGKLPVTFPRSVGQIPCYYNHKPSAKRGYQFTDNSPLFPFGWGLSYTTFEYGKPRLSTNKISPTDSVDLEIEVTNTGNLPGDEVVQLYIHDELATVTRPIKALKDFRRICLQPAETQNVRFTITPDKLALLNQQMAWQVEPGRFEVMVGGNSVEVKTVWLEVKDMQRSPGT